MTHQISLQSKIALDLSVRRADVQTVGCRAHDDSTGSTRVQCADNGSGGTITAETLGSGISKAGAKVGADLRSDKAGAGRRQTCDSGIYSGTSSAVDLDVEAGCETICGIFYSLHLCKLELSGRAVSGSGCSSHTIEVLVGSDSCSGRRRSNSLVEISVEQIP